MPNSRNESVSQRAKEIERSLRVMHHWGGVMEVRALAVPGRGRPHTTSGYFTDFSLAASCAAELDFHDKPSGIYVVMNELNPGLLARAPNQLKRYPDSTTADGDITKRKWLLIDVDPKRPKGIPSSDEELEASRLVAHEVRDFLMSEHGFYEPIEAMSGNGWHLLFPIELPNDDESTSLIKAILNAASAKFGGENTPNGLPTADVDTTVFNAARITKLYGTVARKGHGIEGRPLRRSKLVSVPHYLEPAEDGGHKNES